MKKSNIRKRRIASMLIALGGAMLLFRSTVSDYISGVSAPDGIYIPNSNYRFEKGEVTSGMYRHTFRIYNLRPRLLRMEAQPDCGCTTVSWKTAIVPPLGWKDVTAQIKAVNSDRGSSTSIGFHSDSRKQPWLFAFLNS